MVGSGLIVTMVFAFLMAWCRFSRILLMMVLQSTSVDCFSICFMCDHCSRSSIIFCICLQPSTVKLMYLLVLGLSWFV